MFTVRIGDHLLFNPYSYGAMAKDMLCLEFQKTKDTTDINNFYTVHFDKTWQSGEYADRLLDGRPIIERIDSIWSIVNALCECLLLDSFHLRLREKQVASLDDYYKWLINDFDDEPGLKLLESIKKTNENSDAKKLAKHLLRILLCEVDIQRSPMKRLPQGEDSSTSYCNQDGETIDVFRRTIKVKKLQYYPDPETYPTIIIPLHEAPDHTRKQTYAFDFGKDMFDRADQKTHDEENAPQPRIFHQERIGFCVEVQQAEDTSPCQDPENYSTDAMKENENKEENNTNPDPT